MHLSRSTKKSGCYHQLKFQENASRNQGSTQERTRKVFWFNPLFSQNIKIKVGIYFLNLKEKNFLPHHKFHNQSKKKINFYSIKIYLCLI